MILAAAFLLTVAVEGLIAAAVLRRFYWLEAAAIQLTTWPIAQTLLWRGGRFWLIELGVAVVEIFLWQLVLAIPLRRAAAVSIAANAATAAIAWLAFRPA